MIFHIPAEVNPNYPVGPHIRPVKMKEAFESIGYDVFTIWGNNRNRKKLINQLIATIKSGKKFEFMYSECWDCPTYFTERNLFKAGIPIDYKLFSLVKKKVFL